MTPAALRMARQEAGRLYRKTDYDYDDLYSEAVWQTHLNAEKPEGLLRIIVRRRLIDYWLAHRDRLLTTEMPEWFEVEQPAPETDAFDPDAARERVAAELRKLPPLEHAAVLGKMNGVRRDQTAKLFNTTEWHVSMASQRGLATLRERCSL